MTVATMVEGEVKASQGALSVRGLAEGEDGAWDAFVRRCPGGTFFHLSGWRRSVEDSFGHDAHYLVAEEGEKIRGVLPLFRIRSPFLGNNLLSVPYAVYGGPLGEDPEVVRQLVRKADELARELSVGYVELRYLEEPIADEAPTTDLYHTFIRELPEDPDACLAMLPKKARAAARQGRDKFGLEVGSGSWYLKDFYHLFHINKRSLGSPGLPLHYFENLVKEYGEDCVIHVVRKDFQPVAAVMSFRFNDTFLPYYSGKLPTANRLNVDNYLYWQLMEECVRLGHRHFDFGRSRKDTGAFKFKKHQGFEPQPLHYRYHLHKKKKPPHFNPSNPKLNLPRTCWTKLPLWLSKALSNPLSRYLP